MSKVFRRYRASWKVGGRFGYRKGPDSQQPTEQTSRTVRKPRRVQPSKEAYPQESSQYK